MLNEIKEYEQYSFNLDCENPEIRLKHKHMCNSLSGIARAMTIVARHSYFGNKGYSDIDSTLNDLRVWCGDSRGDSEKTSEGPEFAWLPNYLIKVLGKDKAEKFKDFLKKGCKTNGSKEYREAYELFKELQNDLNAKTWKDKKRRKQLMKKAGKLKKLYKSIGESDEYAPYIRILGALEVLSSKYDGYGFNSKMFNKVLTKQEIRNLKQRNDFKTIMYEKIVANAIVAGPLKRYYLVCENDDLSKISKKTGGSTKYVFANKNWSNPTKNKMDLILKTLCACLLEEKFQNAEKINGTNSGNEAYVENWLVPVNKTDIANWLVGSIKIDELKSFEIDNRPLFSMICLDNVSLVGVDLKWVKECGWQIISEDDFDSYLESHPQAIFYSDFGSKHYLKKNTRYEVPF